MNLAAFAEQHARALFFVAGTLTIAGFAVATQLPVSLFPTVSFPRVQVLADAGDRPADRMMLEVTRVLEEAVSTVPGLVTVRSVTNRGSCDPTAATWYAGKTSRWRPCRPCSRRMLRCAGTVSRWVGLPKSIRTG